MDELVIQKALLSGADIKGYYDALVATLPPQGC